MKDVLTVGLAELPEDLPGIKKMIVNYVPFSARAEGDGYAMVEHHVFGEDGEFIPRSGLRVVSYFDLIFSRNDRYLVKPLVPEAMEPVIILPTSDFGVENLHARLAVAASTLVEA